MSLPCFIVGATRSGTTLLRFLLDAHPHIAGLDELNFGTELVGSFVKYIGQQELYDEMGLPPYDEMRKRFAELHRFPRDAIAAKRGKQRWVDNTHTTNDYFVEVIDELYDGQ